MTDIERLVVAALIASLEAVQWAVPMPRHGFVCPSCRYAQARGHKCSCPIRLALRNAKRVLGEGEMELEDDDLIVERAVRALVVDEDGALYRASIRDVVQEAVTAGIAYGQRSGKMGDAGNAGNA